MNENTLQNIIQERYSHIGPIWRNNVGVAVDATGRHIRYGLANTSQKMNAHVKSSDLIAIRPVLAYLPLTGWCKLGIFTAIEVKAPGWRLTPGDERAHAQAKFHDIVREAGGLAGFATDIDDIGRIIKLT